MSLVLLCRTRIIGIWVSVILGTSLKNLKSFFLDLDSLGSPLI